MAGNISQAEKWRQWKQKMQVSTPMKSPNKPPEKALSPNMAQEVSDTQRSLQYNKCKTSASYDECGNTKDKTKTYDKTLHMVEEFISQCRHHVDKNNDEPTAFDKTFKTHRQVAPSGIELQVPIHVRVESPQKTNEKPSKITYSKSKKSKDSDIEIVYVSTFKPNNLSNDKAHKSDKKIENKFGNKNITFLNKRPNFDNDSGETPVKRSCTSILNVQNDRATEGRINNVTRDKRNSIQVEKTKRTVRFVENNDGTSEQDKDAAAKDKGNVKNLNHVSVVEALQSEGRRIMVDYLAEYETNSESSGDEGIVHTKIVRQTENIKFTVHLSSSMKTIKPYRCVLFDVIETNEGKAYSPTTGRFIAPQKGTYGFFLTITSAKKEQPEVSIIHNFHPLESSKIKTNKQEDGEMQTKTDAILLSLEKHDEIWLLNVTRIAQVQQLENCHFLSFSGFLLKL